ncbi:ATP-binding protein [Desulfobacterales bacterium HSG16]|nr:ATP-binding protein [Desulfobacterales bacterium HSG16]
MVIKEDDMEKVYKSIRIKLIYSNMMAVCLIFMLVLSVITVLNIISVHKTIEKSEHDIRDALITKGKTLANNNAMAIRGMAEEYAFTAIQTLVSATVKDDPDIEYGIFMDQHNVPWVNASSKNQSGIVRSPDPLTDTLSQWAGSLTAPSDKTSKYEGEKQIEFATPVVVDGEILGCIRYGFNTLYMQKALKEVYENGRQSRNQVVSILIMIGLISLAVSFFIVKRLASAITHPIGSLAKSANAISEGNYNIKIIPESNDEIGELAAHFESMRAKIKQYTDHLQELVDEKMQQVNDILNNIDQGLFTINLDGTINREYSARANGILKVEDIASSSLNDILRMDKKQERAFYIWMNLIKNKHSRLRWKKLTRLAPVRELELVSNNNILDYISIEYQRIYNKEGELSKIMILALDETEKRIKEYQMDEQKLQHENEMNIVLGLVNISPAEISEFMEDTTDRMQSARKLVAEHIEDIRYRQSDSGDASYINFTQEQINSLYRDIHTIKGNSGSYGFQLLAKHAHEAEDLLEKLRGSGSDNRKFMVLTEVAGHLDFMNTDIDEIQQKIKLLFGKDEDAVMRVPKSLVNNILKTSRDAADMDSPPKIQKLIHDCAMLLWLPIETITRKYQKVVNRLARRSRKNIKFLAEPKHMFFPPDILYDIDDILVHLIRNAADHGIESPEIREELGKGMGQVRFELTMSASNHARIIRIIDNGKGIDIEKLVGTCLEKGIVTSEYISNIEDEEKLKLIFSPGISTADKVTDVSGRGMGMNIVRHKLNSIGGNISVKSEKDAGTTITLELPPCSETGKNQSV